MQELNPQPLPPRERVVRVHVSHEISYDLGRMQKITAEVLNRLGCGGCHSGRLLDFINMEEFVVNPETLTVSPVVGLERF